MGRAWGFDPGRSNTDFESPRRARTRYPGPVSLVQLESFVAVAEEEHVGRAAARLHVTQPPLTRRIRSLEDELGVVLFQRTPRGMKLLPPGERLLSHAREILAKVEDACRELRDARSVRRPGPRRRAHGP